MGRFFVTQDVLFIRPCKLTPTIGNLAMPDTAPPSLKRYAWLSIACALLTIVLKTGAYHITGSVGLLSDALESGVNLIAAICALFALTVAELPPDDDHTYGHSKAEYFSSGIEGALIIVAALTIIATSIPRYFTPCRSKPSASVSSSRRLPPSLISSSLKSCFAPPSNAIPSRSKLTANI